MKAALLLAFSFTLPPAGAAAPPAGAPAQGPRTLAFTLAPGKVHEECLRLEAGRARAWSWKADRATAFNIHFHRDKDVAYPVLREGMAEAAGRFVAKSGEDYCWMWTGGRETTKVTGTIGPEE